MHSYKDSDWDDISSAAKLRKVRKPLVERKRRERINTSLMELKSLILQAMCKKESDYEKMEKADVLEMTVHFLRTLHQSQRVHATRKYQDGFQECAAEVRRYLGSVSGVEHTVRRRMDQYLASRIHPAGDVVKPEASRLPRLPLVPVAVPSPMAFFPGYYSCQETPMSSIPAASALKPGGEDYHLSSLRHVCASAAAATSTAASAGGHIDTAHATTSTTSSSVIDPEPAGNGGGLTVRRTLFGGHGDVQIKVEPEETEGEARVGEQVQPGGDVPENPTESAWRPWS